MIRMYSITYKYKEETTRDGKLNFTKTLKRQSENWKVSRKRNSYSDILVEDENGLANIKGLAERHGVILTVTELTQQKKESQNEKSNNENIANLFKIFFRLFESMPQDVQLKMNTLLSDEEKKCLEENTDLIKKLTE